MATKIENKVTLKLYGDQDLQIEIINLLVDNGLTKKGCIEEGNPYTTKADKSGWAATVNIFGSEEQ